MPLHIPKQHFFKNDILLSFGIFKRVEKINVAGDLNDFKLTPLKRRDLNGKEDLNSIAANWKKTKISLFLCNCLFRYAC